MFILLQHLLLRDCGGGWAFKSVSDAGGCLFIRRESRFYISLYRVVTFRLYSLTRGLGTSRVPTLLVSALPSLL
jgi:hypothetical protein